jgi:copper homeostasis protein CutC
VSSLAASVNTVGTALPTLANLQNGHTAMNQIQATFTTGVQQVLDTGQARYPNAGAGFTFNLVAQAAFAVSTMTATGWIAARRRR